MGNSAPITLFCQGIGPDFAPVAEALTYIGIGVTQGAESATPAPCPIIRIADAVLAWQAIDDPQLRIAALQSGMDDVVGPWMDRQEVVARILRLGRDRADAPPVTAPPASIPDRIACGELSIGLLDRDVARAGQPIRLLAREYALLLHLARHPERPFSRTQLLRAIWRLEFDPGTNSVEVHMSRLRGKVDRGFAWPMLRTVKMVERGAGYALFPAAPGAIQ